MSHRRLIATAAMLAAGLVLIPATAQAAGPAPVPRSSDAEALSKSSAFRTFSSPAGPSVRPRTAAGALSVDLEAYGISGRGIELAADLGGAPAGTSVSIAWGDGSVSTATSGLVEGGHNVASAQHSYPKLGSYTITVTAGSGGTTASNSVEVTTAGSHYTPYGPTRLMDTRERGKVQGWSSVKLRIGGNGGIPAGVTAVVLNVTVTEAESAGFLTAFPYGGNRPATSNVNFTAGQTVPNMVIVPVGADGSVQLYNGSGGAVQMIADVSGYFTQSVSSGYTPVPPARLVDTRDGLGAPRGQIAGRGSIPVQVAGVGRLPGAGITAVALNVTATESRNQGFLTVHPSGTARPNASNLNFGTGQTIANSVVVPVGSDGKIQVFNGSGDPADVIVDVVGYYSADGNSSYLPIDPERLADTRTAEWSSTPVPGGGYLPLALGDGMPGVTGFVLNTTVTGTRSAGFLTVAPDPNSLAQYQDRTAVWPDRPTVSSLNWQRPGATVPNLVQAVPGPYGIVDFWNAGGGDADLVVDMFGYYDKS